MESSHEGSGLKKKNMKDTGNQRIITCDPPYRESSLTKIKTLGAENRERKEKSYVRSVEHVEVEQTN